jgi:hypothetical protein
MANPQDVELVIEKIKAVTAQGDECMGMLSDKTMAEWTEIFNEAAGKLNMPVLTVGALKSGSMNDIMEHLGESVGAFRKSAGKPAIILCDTSGNRNVTDQKTNFALADVFEKLAQQYPKAIYIQVITEGTCSQPVCLYSMKPHIPRPPGTGRIDPV